MTGSAAPSTPSSLPPWNGPPSESEVEETADRPRAGTPTRPGTFDGRAHNFRKNQAQRRSARRGRLGELLVVAIIILGIYTIVTARPYSSSNYSLPPSGPTITVNFGSPTVSTISCTAGGTANVERIPFANASQPIATGDVILRVSEIWDGDHIGDPGVVANATPSNVCAGAPPSATTVWYVVLEARNGTNLLTYTEASAWTSISVGPSNLGIENGSTFILVSHASYAGTGRGFALVGTENGSVIRGVLPL